MAYPSTVEELTESIELLKQELSCLSRLRKTYPAAAKTCDRGLMDDMVDIVPALQNGLMPPGTSPAMCSVLIEVGNKYLNVAYLSDQSDDAGGFAAELSGRQAVLDARAHLATLKNVAELVSKGTPLEWAIAYASGQGST
ncbi:hypothetical protein [Mycolicibacterium poriferae]|uniref:hypothetical protein n=1 Tax=Mycolicibacterium poriferae TaxID=39694 RepID=UPI0024BADFB7|nr:hypothetical protein [Mycolicibacterium poriferae]